MESNKALASRRKGTLGTVFALSFNPASWHQLLQSPADQPNNKNKNKKNKNQN